MQSVLVLKKKFEKAFCIQYLMRNIAILAPEAVGLWILM
jgi:hypothetical protein